MRRSLALGLMFVGGLAVGGFGVQIYHHRHVAPPIANQQFHQFYDRVFNDEFFQNTSAPFEQMDRTREEMGTFLAPHNRDISRISYREWYERKFGGSPQDISRDADKNYIYYRLNVGNVDPKTVKVVVTNGYVSVNGNRVNIQAQEDGPQSRDHIESVYSFNRTFPVPAGVKTNRVRQELKGDELILKFPRKR